MYFGVTTEGVVKEEFNLDNDLFTKYINESFGETVLNEANNAIEAEIKALFKKDKITEGDIRRVHDKIMNAETTKAQAQLLGLFTISMLGAITAMVNTITQNYPVAAIALGVEMIASNKISTTVWFPTDRVMYKIMKTEAALRNKKKKLDDSAEDKKAAADIDKMIDLCEKLKKAIKSEARKKAQQQATKESAVIDDYTFLEEDYLLEYKGNDLKNDIFVQILDEFEQLCKANIEFQDAILDVAKRQLAEFKKAKDMKSLNAAATKIRDIGIEGNKECPKVLENNYGPMTFRMLDKEIRKFNNKYSFTGFQSKKTLQDKLSAMQKKMSETVKQIDAKSTFVKELDAAYDKAAKINVDLADRCYNTIISWLKYCINEISLTDNDIRVVIKSMGLTKQPNLLFKILNFKELKSELSKKAK